MSLGTQIANTGVVLLITSIILLIPFIGQKAGKIIYTLLGILIISFLLIPIGAIMDIWM